MGHMKMKETSPWNLVGGTEHTYDDEAVSTNCNKYSVLSQLVQLCIWVFIRITYWVLPSSARNILEAERETQPLLSESLQSKGKEKQ